MQKIVSITFLVTAMLTTTMSASQFSGNNGSSDKPLIQNGTTDTEILSRISILNKAADDILKLANEFAQSPKNSQFAKSNMNRYSRERALNLKKRANIASITQRTRFRLAQQTDHQENNIISDSSRNSPFELLCSSVSFESQQPQNESLLNLGGQTPREKETWELFDLHDLQIDSIATTPSCSSNSTPSSNSLSSKK